MLQKELHDTFYTKKRKLTVVDVYIKYVFPKIPSNKFK